MQVTSGKDVKENLKKILNIIHECIKERSDLIITPECTSIMSSDKKELLSINAIIAAIKRIMPLEDSNFKKSLITLRKIFMTSFT